MAAVEVVAAASVAAAQQAQQQQQQQGPPQAALQKRQTFTWCLERVRQGPLKNCWLTVGVRVGDYANV